MDSHRALTRVLGVAIAAAVSMAVVTAAALAVNPAGGTTTTGQALNIIIDSPADGASVPVGGLTVEGRTSIGPLASQARAVYVIDNSGSTTAHAGDCDGNGAVGPEDDFNSSNEGTGPGSILDCEISGLIALNRSLFGTNVQAGMVGFASQAAVADVGPGAGEQAFTPVAADANGSGGSDIEQVARSTNTGGFGLFTPKSFFGNTNYNDALTKLNGTLTGQPGQKIGFFLSDGVPCCDPSSFTTGPGSPLEATAAAGTKVNTYSVGNAAGACSSGTPLKQIADATGGTCTAVSNPANLATVIPGTTPTGIERVDVSVNGGPQTQASLDALGNWSADVNVVPGANVIRSTVTATDGTQVTADITVNGARKTTNLVAEPSVASLQRQGLKTNVLVRLRAHLTSSGQPLAGKTVTFRTGSRTLCTVQTAADGAATCQSLFANVFAVLGIRYTASFAGDATHDPSSDQGVLLEVGQLSLL